jgi:hypothetical protein
MTDKVLDHTHKDLSTKLIGLYRKIERYKISGEIIFLHFKHVFVQTPSGVERTCGICSIGDSLAL